MNIDELYLLVGVFLIASTLFHVAVITLRDKTSSFVRAAFVLSGLFFLLSGVSVLYFFALNIQSALFTAVLIFFAINALRGIMNRYALRKLKSRLEATWWRLLLAAAAVWLGFQYVSLAALFVLSVIVSGLFLLTAFINLLTKRVRNKNMPIVDWPTVSLLIPARNEDSVLDDALTNLLTLDYPKLEDYRA